MNDQPIDFESAEFALQQSWEMHRHTSGFSQAGET